MARARGGKWRRAAASVIYPIVLAHRDADGRTLRRLVRAAYPFGERRSYPYKAWLKEVRALCGRVPVPPRPPLEKDHPSLPLEDVGR